MHRFRLTASLLLSGVLVLTAACSEESDEPTAEVRADAGTDTGPSSSGESDEPLPTVDSIDPDETEPAETRRIRVETAHQAGIIPESPPLAAESYIDTERVESFFDDDELQAASVTGQKSSQHHNSIRYRPTDADRFGIGLQVWDLEETDQSTADRIDELRDQFLGVQQIHGDALPDGAFRSRRAGVRNLVFAAESGPYVFILSCDDETCAETDEMLGLAAELAAQH